MQSSRDFADVHFQIVVLLLYASYCYFKYRRAARHDRMTTVNHNSESHSNEKEHPDHRDRCSDTSCKTLTVSSDFGVHNGDSSCLEQLQSNDDTGCRAKDEMKASSCNETQCHKQQNTTLPDAEPGDGAMKIESQGMKRSDHDHKAHGDSHKVFVGNISFSVRAAELKDFFSLFGQVLQVNLLRDRNRRRSRGIAFVTFSCVEEAERARNASDYELMLDGRLMKCSALERKTRKHHQDKKLETTSPCHPSYSTDTAHDECQQISSGSGVHINDLPDELFLKILHYLNVKERVQIEAVCHKWRELALASWLSLDSLEFTNLFPGFSFVKASSAKGAVALNDSILKSILIKGCYNLRYLDLSASPRFLTARSLNFIGQVCKDLKYLNLSNTKVNNTTIKTLTNGCRKIETIILKKCHELGEKGVWWLFHNCENLISVDLQDNNRINGKCFHILNKECQTVLVEGCSSLTDKGLDCLTSKCGSLLELNISSCVGITDRGFSNLTERCPYLKILNVSGIHSKVTSTGLQSVRRLAHLETLWLTNHQTVDDAVLFRLALDCTNVREVKIDGCFHQNVSDAGMQSLSKCPHLEILNISYLGQLSDEGLKSLAFSGRLQKLVARSCSNFTDKGIQDVALHCANLYELDVCGCSQLTVASVQVFLEARKMQDGNRSKTLVLYVGGTAISKETLEELEMTDPAITIYLQNLSAPPGQYYPAILPSEEDWDEDDDQEIKDGEKQDSDPNEQRESNHSDEVMSSHPRSEIEYLQNPADSDHPWDGVPYTGHLAMANPELVEFNDVEEDLMGADARWRIPEEYVDDFLDADDPAMMDDFLCIS